MLEPSDDQRMGYLEKQRLRQPARSTAPAQSGRSASHFSFQNELVVCNIAHEGKHLPKATSNFGDPLMRILLRSSAHSRLRSFARKPSHVSLSAITCRSATP